MNLISESIMNKNIKEVTVPYDKLDIFTIDPIAEENPMLDENQLKALQDDIAVNGQQSPVIIYKDKIIDGRNRVQAIKNLEQDLKVIYVNNIRIIFSINNYLVFKFCTEIISGYNEFSGHNLYVTCITNSKIP